MRPKMLLVTVAVGGPNITEVVRLVASARSSSFIRSFFNEGSRPMCCGSLLATLYVPMFTLGSGLPLASTDEAEVPAGWLRPPLT
jgi:hypothetical protein